MNFERRSNGGYNITQSDIKNHFLHRGIIIWKQFNVAIVTNEIQL